MKWFISLWGKNNHYTSIFNYLLLFLKGENEYNRRQRKY